MPTYLLTWNPTKWSWDTLAEEIQQIARDGFLDDRWSCGSTRRIKVGDRFFLFRQAVEPRGIMGSGTVTGERFEERHFEATRAAAGDTAGYVGVCFDTLLDPDSDPLLPREFLLSTAPFSAMHWDAESSGTSIRDDIAAALESEWAKLLASTLPPLPEELPAATTLPEGARRQITVNAYERNASARNQCLAHYGPRCVACGLDLADIYGLAGAGVIHVHHLRPLASIGDEYRVDPLADLRPVCPNCHAIIHTQNPPFTVEQMQAIVRQARERVL